MKFEAWGCPPRLTKFRYADGVEEIATSCKDGPAPACVTMVIDVNGGMLTFYLPLDQADQLVATLSAALSAAQTMPVEERVHDLKRTSSDMAAEVEQRMKAIEQVSAAARGGK